jgi:hypothetical protein
MAKLLAFSGASTQFSSGDIPSPKALPSQLNSAGSEPFTSNEGLVISNADPLEEELLEDELLDDDEELLELDEELLEDELLELDEELLDADPPEGPPQLAIAADSKVMLHAKTILFMVVSYLKRLIIKFLSGIPNNTLVAKTLF